MKPLFDIVCILMYTNFKIFSGKKVNQEMTQDDSSKEVSNTQTGIRDRVEATPCWKSFVNWYAKQFSILNTLKSLIKQILHYFIELYTYGLLVITGLYVLVKIYYGSLVNRIL